MQNGTPGRRGATHLLSRAVLTGALVAAFVLAGAGGTHAQASDPLKTSAAGGAPAASALDAPGGLWSRRAYTADAGMVARIPHAALMDERVPTIRYHSLREFRFLGAVHHARLSHDLRLAPEDQLLGVGADMCLLVKQFGGNRAAAARGLAAAFRDNGQAGLIDDGGRLLRVSVQFLCPPRG